MSLRYFIFPISICDTFFPRFWTYHQNQYPKRRSQTSVQTRPAMLRATSTTIATSMSATVGMSANKTASLKHIVYQCSVAWFFWSLNDAGQKQKWKKRGTTEVLTMSICHSKRTILRAETALPRRSRGSILKCGQVRIFVERVRK